MSRPLDFPIHDRLCLTTRTPHATAASHPTRQEAATALRTLLRWIGEDPDRPGLQDTPDRVLRAYGEFFAGYAQDPAQVLERTFDELDGYRGPVVVRDIELHSHCEHHMVPFHGVAHIAYLPDQRVVGLSKIARLVDLFARRLQIQERLTAQIAQALETHLGARGVAVVIAAEHQCMSSRGVRKHGARTLTTQVTGVYADDPVARAEILRQLGVDGAAA
jgi:GTP cyclohydrolase I